MWARGEREGIRARRKAQQRDRKRVVRAERIAKSLCIGCGTPVKRFQRCSRCRRKSAEDKKRYRGTRFVLKGVPPVYRYGIRL
jgi:hypothetical protein